jgi:hypothetical protein
MAVREEMFSKITKVFKRHGAVTIDTPVFELKVGEKPPCAFILFFFFKIPSQIFFLVFRKFLQANMGRIVNLYTIYKIRVESCAHYAMI